MMLMKAKLRVEGRLVAWMRRAGLVFLAMLVVFLPSSSAYAALPDEATLDMYNANGIYYYNASGGVDCGPGSVGLVDGEGNAAYIWNWFAKAGIPGVSDNPAVIAGIMGNSEVESWSNPAGYGMNPFSWGPDAGGYYGLFMSNARPGYDPAVRDSIYDNGWEQYLHTLFEAPTAPPDIVEKAIDIQLTHLITENNRFRLDGDSWSFVKNLDVVSEKTPEAYAELFVAAVEGATGLAHGDGYIEDPGVRQYTSRFWGGQTAYQGIGKRRDYARKFYDQFANSTTNFVPVTGSSNVDAEGWVGGIEGLQKEPANIALTDDIVLDKFSTPNGKPNMIILHYTAGLTAGLAAYGGNYYPAHFTIDLKKKIGYQHFPLNKPSLAVSGYDGYAIQIEIVGCGYNGEGFGVDAGCMRASGGYSLDQLQDADWDYLAYYLNAISQYTGVPLTSTVVWDANHKELSDAETKNYKGVLGHMHVHGNGKVDPGNIWPDVEAALKRNPSSTYNDACIPSGAVSGGLNLEQAKKFMQVYRKIQDEYAGYKSGYVSEWDLWATNCAGGGLANCVAVSQYFVNRYTGSYRENHFLNTCNGGRTVECFLVDNANTNSFTDGGHTPKVYAIFSGPPSSTRVGARTHTGVVLGIDEPNNKIIIGEAGCSDTDPSSRDWTGAFEYPLDEFSTEYYVYAYTDVLYDEIQKTISAGA